jgi:hypothetical protein
MLLDCRQRARQDLRSKKYGQRRRQSGKASNSRGVGLLAQKHPQDAIISGGMAFFTYLQRDRPDLLLDFKSPGDKRQIVHAWLLQGGKLTK